MRRIIISIIFLLIIGILAANLSFFWNHKEDPSKIKVSGNIELTEVELSFKIPGRVIERPVDEGDTIKEGQLVALLEPTELMQEVNLRQAEVAAAAANLLELENGYLPEEIAQAEARLKEVQAEQKRIQSDFNRQKNLLNTNVISPKEFESTQASYDANAARLMGAQEYLQFYLRGTRQEKIDQAKANLDRAKDALAIANTRLDYATLLSPLSGSVLTKVTEPGEYVIAGTPIVTVGNLDDVWLRAYINETDLSKIKLGQKAMVTTDTYPDKKYEGTISFISSEAEFTPKTIQTFKERVTLVYRIKIDIPNPNWELKPGMPADAFISID